MADNIFNLSSEDHSFKSVVILFFKHRTSIIVTEAQKPIVSLNTAPCILHQNLIKTYKNKDSLNYHYSLELQDFATRIKSMLMPIFQDYEQVNIHYQNFNCDDEILNEVLGKVFNSYNMHHVHIEPIHFTI